MVISLYCGKKTTQALIRANLIQESQQDVFLYCFDFLYDVLFYNCSLIILGFLTKSPLLALTYALSFSPARMLAGGVHANSRASCSIWSYLVFGSTMILSKAVFSQIPPVCMAVVFAVSLIAVYLLTPVLPLQKKTARKNPGKIKRVSLFYYGALAIAFLLFYSHGYFLYNTCMMITTISVLTGQIIGTLQYHQGGRP